MLNPTILLLLAPQLLAVSILAADSCGPPDRSSVPPPANGDRRGEAPDANDKFLHVQILLQFMRANAADLSQFVYHLGHRSRDRPPAPTPAPVPASPPPPSPPRPTLSPAAAGEEACAVGAEENTPDSQQQQDGLAEGGRSAGDEAGEESIFRVFQCVRHAPGRQVMLFDAAHLQAISVPAFPRSVPPEEAAPDSSSRTTGTGSSLQLQPLPFPRPFEGRPDRRGARVFDFQLNRSGCAGARAGRRLLEMAVYEDQTREFDWRAYNRRLGPMPGERFPQSARPGPVRAIYFWDEQAGRNVLCDIVVHPRDYDGAYEQCSLYSLRIPQSIVHSLLRSYGGQAT